MGKRGCKRKRKKKMNKDKEGGKQGSGGGEGTRMTVQTDGTITKGRVWCIGSPTFCEEYEENNSDCY